VDRTMYLNYHGSTTDIEASGARLRESSPLRPYFVSEALYNVRAGLEMKRKEKQP
jgi:hypothetical protein